MYIIVFLLDGKIYKWGSSGFDLGSITFLVYTYDLPKITEETEVALEQKTLKLHCLQMILAL
jgi:hypothetical protein